ncbi:NAD-dependent epimerase/dehydratase family protein [Magnetococcales bacterium HHB-1]
MASYLITGGCGFIGSHLAEALIDRGDAVRILDDLSSGDEGNPPKNCEIMIGDVADENCAKRAMQDMDGCFHLAAEASVVRSTEDWLGTHRTNQTGTLQILNAARKTRGMGIPVIYASSAAVYGNNRNIPLKEESTLAPLTAYGADKLGSELHAAIATGMFQVPTMGFRFFNVFGPRQDPSSPYSGVISIFADAIQKQKKIIIHGDGKQSRDFVYVKDIVRFLLKGLEKLQQDQGIQRAAKVLNVCHGQSVTIHQLALTLFDLFNQTTPLEFGLKRAGDIKHSLGDPSQAQNILAIKPKIPLKEGLTHLVQYLREKQA